MRTSDSPIGNAYLEESRKLESNVAAAKANTELSLASQRQQFKESVRQFQEALNQKAFENRLTLANRGSVPGGGARTPGSGAASGIAASNAINQALQTLAQNRGTSSSTSNTLSPLSAIGAGGSLIGGTGTLLTGIDALTKSGVPAGAAGMFGVDATAGLATPAALAVPATTAGTEMASLAALALLA